MRLTLGLARRYDSKSSREQHATRADAEAVLDRRKRKREENPNDGLDSSPCPPSQCIYWLIQGGADVILTPGSTPLPRALNNDLPLLAHRYQPLSLAGDGAFSRTILARDVLNPREPLVAIKAMKPGFEILGQNVRPAVGASDPGRSTNYCDGYRTYRCQRGRRYRLSWLVLHFLRGRRSI